MNMCVYRKMIIAALCHTPDKQNELHTSYDDFTENTCYLAGRECGRARVFAQVYP